MSEKNKAKQLLNKILKGRPQPSAPRAGYKASGTRYEKDDQEDLTVLLFRVTISVITNETKMFSFYKTVYYLCRNQMSFL